MGFMRWRLPQARLETVISRIVRALLLAAVLLSAGVGNASAYSVEASRGSVAAELWWDDGDEGGWSDLWLTVTRDDEAAYDRAVRFRGCEEPSCVPAAALPFYRRRQPLQVRDLDADQEPEVIAEVLTSTGHCCKVALVLRWDGRRYEQAVHNFGIPDARLRDLGRNGRPEFVSADGRFAYAFDSFAGSWFPPQVWSYERGRFRDATRSHPGLIRDHARAAKRAFERYADRSGAVNYGGGALAAWVADQRLLGNGRAARDFLDRQRRSGRIDNLSGYRSASQFLVSLDGKLRRWGY